MREDSEEFAARNQARAKEPRLVVRIVFDVASIYVTSDADMVNVPGENLLGHLQRVSAVSQEIHPDEARSTIGSMSFALVDIESAMTDALRNQLQVELQNLRGRTVELRLGYTNDYNDTQVLFTQQVKGCEYDDGTYRIACNDVQRETRKDIFEPVVTNLRLSVDADDDVIPVVDTTGYQAVFHGPSYTDAPNLTVGYIRLEDEIIRYTATTADSFTGCTRGVFNTVAVAHEVQAGAAADRQPEVEEFIYLELPGPKLAYAILTGTLDGDAATLPPHWHLGVDASLVNLTQFQTIGPDLWDTTDDDATLVLRFAGLEKTDGKRFLEEQVYQPLGVYSPVLNDGRLGLRRMNHILADAPYVLVLDEDSFTQVGALTHDYDALLNVFSIDWNWDPIAERFTRRRKVIDQGSIDVHGEADTKELAWQGLHGSRHTVPVLLQRSDSIRDRYAGPPLRLTGNLLHRYNVLEVGDVVRVRLEHVRDYTGAAGPIDRSFEVQRIAVDQISGDVSVSLFGSSQRSSVLPPDTGTALPDAWYPNAGTELSTVVTISAGVIQPGTYNLTGHANLKNTAAVYYFLGDLELADGATLTVNDNVQLRIRGFFTINGDIDGIGRGQAGAIDDGIFANANAGSAGFIGDTRGWEGLNHIGNLLGLIPQMRRWAGPLTEGRHSAFPFLELSVRGGELTGLPDDIRGTSGGIGGRIVNASDGPTVHEHGGTGGDGGAGLAIICRGASLGASASINVSGGNGAAGTQINIGHSDFLFQSGSGAPGGPGGVLCVVDGSGPSLPDLLGGLTGSYGTTPSAGEEPTGESADGFLTWAVEQIRAGHNTSIVGDSTASILRVQRLAPEQSPEEDVTVPAPANLAVAVSDTGTAHVLTSTPPPAGMITEYFGSITNVRGDAVLLGDSTVGRFVHSPAPHQQIFYWARSRDIATRRVSLFTPNTTTTTIVGGPVFSAEDLMGPGRLVNGGFETGTTEGWTQGAGAATFVASVSGPRTGTYRAQLTLTPNASNSLCFQRLPAPPAGDRLLLQGFAARGVTPNRDLIVGLSFRDPSLTQISFATIATADKDISDWQDMRGPAVVPTGARFVDVSVVKDGPHNTDETGAWALDDFSLHVIQRGADIIEQHVTDDPADGDIDYLADTQPSLENSGVNGEVDYTAPADVDAQVTISWSGQAQISNLTSGTAVGEARLRILVQINSVSVFHKWLVLESFNASTDWGVFAGTRTFTVPAGQTIEAFLNVHRNFSTSGASPAQTITWRDCWMNLQASKR